MIGLDATTVYFAVKSSVDGIVKLHPLDQISQFSVASKKNFSWFDIFKFRKHSVLSGTLSYFKDGASLCHSAYILYISGWSEKYGFFKDCAC